MIRHTIIDLFKRNGNPPTLDMVASWAGKTRQAIDQELASQEKLDDLCGLSLKQAFELIQFYGSDVLFTDSIVTAVGDAVSIRERIKRIESKKGSGNPPPQT